MIGIFKTPVLVPPALTAPATCPVCGLPDVIGFECNRANGYSLRWSHTAGCYLPGIAEFEATDVARLLDFAERARELLREMEWTEHGDMGDPPTCFRCHREKREGHASGCELAALLGLK